MKADGDEAERREAVAEETRRLRLLRTVVDLTCSVLAQERMGRAEAEALVAAARARVLELFPDKEDTYELILAPRFARLVDEYAVEAPRRVLPFRRRGPGTLPPRAD